jgi:hypothetical protein
MPSVGAERWFQTLVVVVCASLTGCGGTTTDTGTRATSGSGGASSAGGSGGASSTGGAAHGGTASGGLDGGTLTSPSICKFAAQFVCDDYATRTNCRCDTTAPLNMSDCKNPLDYQCAARLPCTPRPPEICLDYDVGCHCDPSGLRPSDCATPQQFFCKITSPYYGDCRCEPEAPPVSCTRPYFLCCQSDDPQFGCDCSCAHAK